MLVYPLIPVNYGLDTVLVPVGLALSFPTSDSSASVEYVVNRVWRDEEPDYELL